MLESRSMAEKTQF